VAVDVTEPVRRRIADRLTRSSRAQRGLAAFLLYAVLAVAMFHPGTALHLASRYVGSGRSDQMLYVWALGWWPHALLLLHDPLFTPVLWAPGGVSLAWVTAVPGAAILMAPVTLAFGPIVALNLSMYLAAAAAAWAAYLLCSRVTRSFPAALAGGFLFGFSPAVSGQMNGHLNLVLVFPIPLAVYLVVRRLAGDLGTVAFVASLAATLVLLFSFSTELFATATMFGVLAFAVTLAIGAADRRRLIETGWLIAGAYVAVGAIVSPYLYAVLRNPPAFARNVARSSSDLLAFAYPTRGMLFGGEHYRYVTHTFSMIWVGDGAYVPLPVMAALVCAVIATRRAAWTWVAVFVLSVACVLSLGPDLHVGGTVVGGWMPFRLLQAVPGLRLALPDRFSLYAWLAIALLVAAWTATTSGWRRWVAWSLLVLGAVLLVPRPRMPGDEDHVRLVPFFADGTYRSYLSPNEIVLPIPFGQKVGNAAEMLWLAETDDAFRVAGGHIGWVPIGDRSFVTRALIRDEPASLVPDEIRSYLRAHRVGAVIVEAPFERRWDPLIASALGASPVEVGGVSLFRVPARLPAVPAAEPRARASSAAASA